MPQFQVWLNTRNTAVTADIMATSVMALEAPISENLPHLLEWTLLYVPLKAVTISVACAPYSTTLTFN